MLPGTLEKPDIMLIIVFKLIGRCSKDWLASGCVSEMQMKEMQTALGTLPAEQRPSDTSKLTKAELVRFLCEMLLLDWTDLDAR